MPSDKNAGPPQAPALSGEIEGKTAGLKTDLGEAPAHIESGSMQRKPPTGPRTAPFPRAARTPPPAAKPAYLSPLRPLCIAVKPGAKFKKPRKMTARLESAKSHEGLAAQAALQSIGLES